MKKYAIFGNPVSHSKSPQIFNYIFQEYKQDNTYKPVRVNSASEIIQIFDQYELSGANITSPFKETVLPFLDKIDNVANEINAVNTIVRKGEHLYGFNTDVYGVEHTIIKSGLDVKNRKCIVVGSGGAAKAAIYALKMLGAIIYSTNRTDSKSLDLSKKFNCNHIMFKDFISDQHDAYLVVIAVKSFDIDFKDSLKNSIIIDANYDLNKLSIISSRYIDGHDWLVKQASKTFEKFFDKSPNYSLMKSSTEQNTIKHSNIAFIGMPGVGKSFYGEILAKKLNKKFYDTDNLIELDTQTKIKEIFKKSGENKFREMEKEVIKKFVNLKDSLVAFGAGSVLTEDVKKILNDNFIVINLHMPTEDLTRMYNSELNQKDKRPLLYSNNLKEDLETIFNDRKNYYYERSDLTIKMVYEDHDKNVRNIEEELTLIL
ncbi:MAG: hypothetical protein JXR69_02080 [Candidatus Delongbacteria bacterium]|nr:hypothetical protein [Candidatus Delongbacteria bacterium]